ncbi:MAG: MerR family transcriptional regulator [Chloroflexota bacterium]|nr:MerR family transcriptional regulator [Chloroflexota bacterium]
MSLLTQANVVDGLRLQFRSIQSNLTTSISEAADLTGLTDAQLRYAESREMLAPNRNNLDPLAGKGQRRYTTDDLLRAHLIAFFLSHNYSFAEIATFMSDNPAVVHDVLQSNDIRLKTAFDNIDAIQFSRFAVPRLAYFALSLIFERDAMANVGLIIPARADATDLEQIPQTRAWQPPDISEIASADDLGRLGQTLVAWRRADGPLVTLLTAGNPFDRARQPLLKPLADVLLEDSPESAMARASGILLAYESQVEGELKEAGRALRKRRNGRRDSLRATPDPRKVAVRMACEAQRIFNHRLALEHGDELDSAKMQLYAAPELINPVLGDALLNQLADTIVHLGGVEDSARWRWRFAAVLTPRNPRAALREQELVVRAQSQLGPHRIGVTTTSPTRNGGLTYRAFSSGRIVYRDQVSQLDPAVSYIDVEGAIKSAIAAPSVESPGDERGRPSAIIYITSLEPERFNADDRLLIRVMGRLIGEIVQTYNSRGHRPAALTDALADPGIVDPFLAEFLSDSDFTRELTLIFDAILDKLAPDQDPSRHQELLSLTLVGLDINDFASIERVRGGTLARMLTKAIGLRAMQRIEGSFSRGAERTWLFHMWGDRFYALIRDEDDEVVRRRVGRIQRELSGDYTLEGDVVAPARTLATDAPRRQDEARMTVAVRMAGMRLTRQELRSLVGENSGSATEVVAGLARQLENGLRQAREISDGAQRMLWWNSDEHTFIAEDPAEPAPPAPPTQSVPVEFEGPSDAVI